MGIRTAEWLVGVYWPWILGRLRLLRRSSATRLAVVLSVAINAIEVAEVIWVRLSIFPSSGSLVIY